MSQKSDPNLDSVEKALGDMIPSKSFASPPVTDQRYAQRQPSIQELLDEVIEKVNAIKHRIGDFSTLQSDFLNGRRK